MDRVLLVEDSDYKRSRVQEFVVSILPGVHLDVAASFNSAAQALDTGRYELVVMDISLPTYDRSPVESGGRFRALGGRELARKIVRRRLQSRIVFLTQFDSFSDDVHSHNLKSLADTLRADCGAQFAALIYFDSSTSSWKEQLERVLLSK